MAAATRTDAHRPSVMEPADYVWVGAHGAYNDPDQYYVEMDYRRLREHGAYDGDENDYRVIAEDLPWDELTERRACCHCGNTRILNWIFYLHVPSGKIVSVGQRCAELLSLTSRDDIARREELKRAEMLRLLELWRGQTDENERAWSDLLAREDAAGGAGASGNEFVDSLLRYGRRNGGLTEKQVAAVLKGIETREERAAEREAKAAELNDPEPAPVEEGRITIRGRMLTIKSQEGYYGRSTLKMLVLDDRGFKVWGTMPDALMDGAYNAAVAAGFTDTKSALRAQTPIRVEFVAQVERSNDDETFGFYKRPTKAKVID